ncbi:MAG: S24/S26 family peptidase [Alistipes sp.]|nr:S24/S26 family peptidase [Alistipes sp.]
MEQKSVANVATFSVVRDILLEGENVTIAVKGQSMLPFFTSGSTVTLRPIAEADFRLYNVVFADAGDHFVIHRIIALEGDRVTLLGDGNIYGTETMPRSRVYGIVDCSAVHLFFAKLWVKLRPLRRFPLAIFRRVTPK